MDEVYADPRCQRAYERGRADEAELMLEELLPFAPSPEDDEWLSIAPPEWWEETWAYPRSSGARWWVGLEVHPSGQ